MASRMDDLVPLLVPSGSSSDVGFASGTVETWNPDTGSNAIRVAGAVLQDVPVLNTGEAITLRAGHVVAMIRFKSSYFILGRVTIPGDEQFASAAVAFATERSSARAFGISSGFNWITSHTFTGPEWADECLITTIAAGTFHNTANGDRSVMVRVGQDGNTGAAQYARQPLPAGEIGPAFAARSDVLEASSRGSFATNPIKCGLLASEGGTSSWPAGSDFNFVYSTTTAIFRSTA